MNIEDRLGSLWEDIRDDPAFNHLHEDGQALVPGSGMLPSEFDCPKAFIVGKAPGAREQAMGEPFVGQEGDILKQLMGLAGLSPADCWMTYVSKYRTPGNRSLNVREQLDWAPYLRREFALVGAPRLIISIGKDAYSVLNGAEASFLSLPYAAGTVRELRTNDKGEYLEVKNYRLLVPMFAPGLGLLEPKYQGKIERDWEYLFDTLQPWKEYNSKGLEWLP